MPSLYISAYNALKSTRLKQKKNRERARIETQIPLKDKILNKVENFKYLVSVITQDRRSKQDIKTIGQPKNS